MKILAIETSCDETAIAVLDAKGGLNPPAGGPQFSILSNIVSSQIKIHAPWGGVVPSLAKREHQKNLVHVLTQALSQANLLKSKFKNQNAKLPARLRYDKVVASEQIKMQNDLEKILEREPELLEIFLKEIPKIKIPKIDAVAVTVGPGLEPALWVGINFARALSLVWDKPIIPVNHMEGHIMSALLPISKCKNQKLKCKITNQNVKFPALALLVSGGHTELVLIKNPPAGGGWKYKIIGQTRDDAAGEAFDKVAKMLNLGYPGGPVVAEMATKFKNQISKLKTTIQNSNIILPRPMIDSDNYDFSFSGLKTSVLYKLRDLNLAIRKPGEKIMQEICYEFQQAVIDTLISKTIRAAKEYKVKTVIVGGGVIANRELQNQMEKAINKLNPKPYWLAPNISFTGDNAAMIAAAASFHFIKKPFDNLRASNLKADGNLMLK